MLTSGFSTQWTRWTEWTRWTQAVQVGVTVKVEPTRIRTLIPPLQNRQEKQDRTCEIEVEVEVVKAECDPYHFHWVFVFWRFPKGAIPPLTSIFDSAFGIYVTL